MRTADKSRPVLPSLPMGIKDRLALGDAGQGQEEADMIPRNFTTECFSIDGRRREAMRGTALQARLPDGKRLQSKEGAREPRAVLVSLPHEPAAPWRVLLPT